MRNCRRPGLHAISERPGTNMAYQADPAGRAVLCGRCQRPDGARRGEGASKQLGQPVIIDNKPGAGAILGADVVAKSAPDGYTFLVSAAGVVSNSMIKKNMPYKDEALVPVAMIALAPSVVVVPANAPYKDLKEFVAASKKAGNGFHWATAGTGSTPHFVEGILETKYGSKLDVVPYKSGSESITAVLGNQVEATSEASIVVLPYIKSGKLKALAGTWTQRISAYPELPTATERASRDPHRALGRRARAARHARRHPRQDGRCDRRSHEVAGDGQAPEGHGHRAHRRHACELHQVRRRGARQGSAAS